MWHPGPHFSTQLFVLTRLFPFGLQVVDVRHEVNTVFAADALARVTGIPGVAVVTGNSSMFSFRFRLNVCFFLNSWSWSYQHYHCCQKRTNG